MNFPGCRRPWRRKIEPGAVRALMAGIIARAVEDVRGAAPPQCRREAVRWIKSDSTAHPFTYIRICDTLNLPVDRIRKVVMDK